MNEPFDDKILDLMAHGGGGIEELIPRCVRVPKRLLFAPLTRCMATDLSV